MALVLTAEPTDELVTIEEAKRHLRIVNQQFDDEVTAKLKAARSRCERWCGRVLRASTTYTLSLPSWWTGCLTPQYQPLLTVSSVQYYDSSNANQTLASSNYHVVLQTDGPGFVEWSSTSTLPLLYDRPNAVRVAYTAGYMSLPDCAKHAILLVLTCLWGDGKGRELEYAERSAKDLLYAIDWGHYA